MSLFAVNGSEDIDVLPSGVAVVSSVCVDKHSPLNNTLSIYITMTKYTTTKQM